MTTMTMTTEIAVPACVSVSRKGGSAAAASIAGASVGADLIAGWRRGALAGGALAAVGLIEGTARVGAEALTAAALIEGASVGAALAVAQRISYAGWTRTRTA
jgi:hypothetical protein